MDMLSLTAFGLQLGVSVVVAFGTVWAFAARLDQRVKHLEEGMKEGIKSLEEKIKAVDLRERMMAAETLLKERAPSVTKRKSPLSLTERGSSLLVDSGAERFVDEHFDELMEGVNRLNPKTAYDIQEDAKKVIEGLQADDRINPIKEFLFEDGSTLEELVAVMGIYLRDKILAQRPHPTPAAPEPPKS
jgi:hypothetical protein